MKANILSVVAWTILISGSASGATIVSDLFSAMPTVASVGADHVVTWTQTGTYSGVVIAAELQSNNGNATVTGTAYLMTQLGPGTTAGNEVAPPAAVSVFGVPAQNVLTPLFSGLTLGPGTYFVLIDSSAQFGVGWAGTGTPVRTLGTGVTQGSDEQLSGNLAAFQLCLSNSAIWCGSDWTFDAGMGSRARAAWERLALVSSVETVTRRLPVSATLLSSVLGAAPC